MTDKALKKLKRTDLLQLLVDQSRQMEALKVESAATEATLREENAQLRQQLEERRLQVTNAGSLAEATLSVNGVMLAAQQAADQYLDSIRQRMANQDAELARTEAESTARAEKLLADTEQECSEKRAATELACRQQLSATQQLCNSAEEEAIRKIEAYWGDLSGRLESFYASHAGLQQLLVSGNMEPQLTFSVMQSVLMSDEAPAGGELHKVSA